MFQVLRKFHNFLHEFSQFLEYWDPIEMKFNSKCYFYILLFMLFTLCYLYMSTWWNDTYDLKIII